MDESVQKQIEASIATLGRPEHWVWVYPQDHRHYHLNPAGRCAWCQGRYPQSRETCVKYHSDDTGIGPVRIEP